MFVFLFFQSERVVEYEKTTADGTKVLTRKKSRQFVDPKTGETKKEQIEKVFEVDASGAEVLKERTHREEKADGSAVVTEEVYETGEDGEQTMVSQNQTVETATSLHSLHEWEGDFIVMTENEKVVAVEDEGEQIHMKVRKRRKSYVDGKEETEEVFKGNTAEGQSVVKRRLSRKYKSDMEHEDTMEDPDKHIVTKHIKGLVDAGTGWKEEYATDSKGNVVMRRVTRKSVLLPDGTTGDELVQEEYSVSEDGRKVLTKRMRKTVSPDGSAVITQEVYKVGTDGESHLVKESKKSQAAPLKSPKAWEGQCEVIKEEEETTVKDADGKLKKVPVQKQKKVFNDGKVRAPTIILKLCKIFIS